MQIKFTNGRDLDIDAGFEFQRLKRKSAAIERWASIVISVQQVDSMTMKLLSLIADCRATDVYAFVSGMNIRTTPEYA